MAADGNITFSTALDNEQLEKELKAAEKEVDNLKRKLEKSEGSQNAIAKKLEEAENAAAKTTDRVIQLEDEIKKLNSAEGKNPQQFIQDRNNAEQLQEQLARANATLTTQNRTADSLEKKYRAAKDATKQNATALQSATAKAQQLGNAYAASYSKAKTGTDKAKTGITALKEASRNATAAASSHASSMGQAFANVGKRIKTMFKKVFFFSVILAGLRAIKSAISGMLQDNQKLNSAVENLKATLRGVLAPILQAIAPILMNFVNLLSRAITGIAGMIDKAFHTNFVKSIEAQRKASVKAVEDENAKKRAEYQQQVAAEQARVAKANAKKEAAYKKQLTAATKKQEKAEKKLAKAKKKASEKQLMGFDELNVLSEINKELGKQEEQKKKEKASKPEKPDYETAAKIEPPQYDTSWLDNFDDGIGVFDAFAACVAKNTPIIQQGLDRIKQGWDKVVQGFQTGDLSLAWDGITDIIMGAAYVIKGIFFSLCDFLDEITGGRFHTTISGVKQMVSGLVLFLDGVLNGDLVKVFKGLRVFFNGWTTAARGVVDTVFGAISNTIDNFFKFWKTGVNGFFDWLGKKFPQLKPIFESARNIITGAINALRTLVSGAFNFVKSILHNALKFVKELLGGIFTTVEGILTGNKKKIIKGLKGIANAFIGNFEGMINAVIDLINTFLKAAAEKLTGVGKAVGGLLSKIGIPTPQFAAPQIPRVKVPRLAQGAVIPPNREFLAVLGDQPRGSNVEAPEGLLRSIVREEAGADASTATLLAQILEAVQRGSTIYCDGQVLGRVAQRNIAGMAKISGRA